MTTSIYLEVRCEDWSESEQRKAKALRDKIFRFIENEIALGIFIFGPDYEQLQRYHKDKNFIQSILMETRDI